MDTYNIYADLSEFFPELDFNYLQQMPGQITFSKTRQEDAVRTVKNEAIIQRHYTIWLGASALGANKIMFFGSKTIFCQSRRGRTLLHRQYL